MNNVDKLLSLGAYSCAGDLILGRKIVGHLRNGDLVLTDDGKRIIEQDVEDAVVVREKPKRGKAKADQEQAAAPHDALKDLLGG